MNQIPTKQREKPRGVEVVRLEGGGVVVRLAGRLRALLGVLFGDVELHLDFDGSVWLYQAIYKLVMKGRVALEWEPNVAAAIQCLEGFLNEFRGDEAPYHEVQDALDFLKEGRRIDRGPR